MPSQKNQDQVALLKTKLDKAQSFILVNYAGLNSADQTQLRADIKAAGGEFTVSKNRLTQLALKDRLQADLPTDLLTALEGPNATVFGFNDAVAAIKTLVDFAKNHEVLELKVGLMLADSATPTAVLSAADLKALAALPSRQELLAQLISRLQGPTYGLVNVLSGTTCKLVYVLTAIKDHKSN